jgi:hypothetical protein
LLYCLFSISLSKTTKEVLLRGDAGVAEALVAASAAGGEVVPPVVAGVAEEAALVAEVVEASAEVVPDVVSEQKITISNQYRSRYKD